jgi:pyridoxal phosphate enzyme (YggS family)
MSRYKEFLKNFEKSVSSAKRSIEEIEVIAVSKRKSTQDILTILQEGHLSYGENQLQEVKKKWPELSSIYKNTKLHFIGSLQSKKIVDIITNCDVIHALDREKLVNIISKLDKSLIAKKTFFVQINTGSEVQKSGVDLNYAEEFIQLCRQNGIKISGLMCLPPENEQPDKHFQILQSLAKNNHIANLSMGMSNDYDIALKYGSTHIRIGTAIFGKRS